VYTGRDGLDYALAGIYDAIILDVMLPGMDGFQVLQRLRKEGVKTPVCMLTARSGLEDRVHGLESGADYYLPKPFQMAELTACLRAITRRREDAPVMELAFGDIQLNQQEAKLLCTATGQSVKLGAKEYQIMEMFLRNPRQILAKDMIFDRVWGYESEADMSNLEVYLSFVRKKLTFVGSKVKIKASRGIGYSLEEEA
jgi:DNA-binding response OmpR family regulator